MIPIQTYQQTAAHQSPNSQKPEDKIKTLLDKNTQESKTAATAILRMIIESVCATKSGDASKIDKANDKIQNIASCHKDKSPSISLDEITGLSKLEQNGKLNEGVVKIINNLSIDDFSKLGLEHGDRDWLTESGVFIDNTHSTNNINFSGRNISADRMKAICSASTPEKVLYLTLWDKIKDFFCGGAKTKVISLLYSLTHPPKDKTRESVFKMADTLHQLEQLVTNNNKDKFKVDLKPTYDKEGNLDKYIIEWRIGASVRDTIIGGSIEIYDVKEEMDAIKSLTLDNSSGILEAKKVKELGVNEVLRSIEYQGEHQGSALYTSVNKQNTSRLGMDYLGDDKKTVLEKGNEAHLRNWVELGMKFFSRNISFAEYFTQYSVLKYGSRPGSSTEIQPWQKQVCDMLNKSSDILFEYAAKK